MIRELYREFSLKKIHETHSCVKTHFPIHKSYHLGDMVQIVGPSASFSYIGMIIRLPQKHSPFYTVATTEWPYGEWLRKEALYWLEDRYSENQRNGILEDIHKREKGYHYQPKGICPFVFETLADFIYDAHRADPNSDVLPFVWVMKGETVRMPYCHVTFKGNDYGRDYRVRLDKAEYWAEKDLPSLTEPEKRIINMVMSGPGSFIISGLRKQVWQKSIDSAWDKYYGLEHLSEKRQRAIHALKPTKQPDYTQLKRRKIMWL